MRRKNEGFTLMEILVALTILMLVVGVAYSSLQGIFRSKAVLDDKRETRKVANAILNRLSRELQLAYSGIALIPEADNLDQRYSSKVNLIGEEQAGAQDRHLDSIEFLALEGGQYLPDGGTRSGWVQVRYRLAQDPEDQAAKEAGLYQLIREEMPYLRPFEQAHERKMIFPLSKSLLSLRFRYYDRNSSEWTSRWGEGERLGLPAMIEFSFRIMSPAGRVSEFRTTVPLRGAS